ncbi:adenylate kinase [Mycobacterium sp. CBMA293]|uniref:adenylate kinase n=1 Tax=unclassified Mycolicibacterium TaxID=2636767 RepID=UPI0012DE8712|nr:MULTISPECIES: adenylate kinase [unclassified Mycolicibacterium]MUL44812.1 adenylate kinase [Mycolicibacterium sp. CBMA 360]MUL58079.1 adenylate kinase [Mycolicibacterium sp. CBMA 335]MUL73537.1 adenylate kinase [Mycolicibacterium sp. CBMA 311]MUL95405.1 adenylate kinase [Mycolicibacterium sp. CBMA 230]MUM07511.1 adenylate kinase [Mycolicibacterium sp. CBMA 213]
MRLILLSLPGAGKGTQASLLSAATGLRHISSGDVLRAEIAAGTDLGRRLEGYTSRGELVPDDVLFEMLVPVVEAAQRDTGGFLLDGFPRTLQQARRAAELGEHQGIPADAAIYLTASHDIVTARLLDRAAREGRSDDNAEVIERRLHVFETQTFPVVEFYRNRGILVEVDAAREPDVVQADIRNRLGMAKE